MKALLHAITARGPIGAARRAIEILSAYGLSEGKFSRKTGRYAEILKGHGVRPSLAVSGILISRHEKYFCELSGSAELFAHGYRHIDLSNLSAAEQRLEVLLAKESFSRAGFPQAGFRAPYLQKNKGLLTALKDYFTYDSSETVLFSRELPLTADTALGETGPLPHDDGILELPVALPSDICLLNRLRITSQDRIAQEWQAMLAKTIERGGMMVLLLHPENIDKCDKALDRLLSDAKAQGGVWTPALCELAAWWKGKKPGELWPAGCRCALCVTGDIDAVTLQDYVLRLLGG